MIFSSNGDRSGKGQSFKSITLANEGIRVLELHAKGFSLKD
jgi:hypothetical protein